MIAADQIDRSTLVWNPAMPQWAAASTTDLAGLFGNGPPPLPATEISRWPVYALAFFPLIGLAIQAVASAVISARSGRDAQEVFDHGAWLLLFILGNGALGDIDEKKLGRAGLNLRFAGLPAQDSSAASKQPSNGSVKLLQAAVSDTCRTCARIG